MKKTDCETIQNLIPLYIDNMLSDAESHTVREHITSCKACQAELACMQSVVNITKKLPDVEVSPEFHQSLMKKIRMQKQKKEYAFLWKKGAGFVAAAAVVALSVVSFLNMDRDMTKPNPDAYIHKPETQKTAAKPTEQADSSLEQGQVSQKTTDAQKATEGQENTGEKKTPASAKSREPAPSGEAQGKPSEQTEVAGIAASLDTAEQMPYAPARAIIAEGEMAAFEGHDANESLTMDNTKPAEDAFSLVTVTVAEQARAEAIAVLLEYIKDDRGYQVGLNLETVLNQLSALEGYQISTQEGHDIFSNYIILK